MPLAPVPQIHKARPKIGLALGSGGALGWAHIGAIQILEAEGIEADIVTGASMGSIIGACYADHKLDELQDLVAKADFLDVMRLLDLNFLKGGLLGGERIRDLMKEYFGEKPIGEMRKPYAAVASDLVTGDAVILDHGPVVDAIRASISVPGMLSPVVRDGMILVDGGIMQPVPVKLARDMGADAVIAVDVQADYRGRTESLKLAQKALRGKVDTSAVAQAAYTLLIQQHSNTHMELSPADVCIRPATGKLTPFHFLKAEDFIQAGRQATEAVLPQIRQLTEQVDHAG